jgi:hypothetical protein
MFGKLAFGDTYCLSFSIDRSTGLSYITLKTLALGAVPVPPPPPPHPPTKDVAVLVASYVPLMLL